MLVITAVIIILLQISNLSKCYPVGATSLLQGCRVEATTPSYSAWEDGGDPGWGSFYHGQTASFTSAQVLGHFNALFRDGESWSAFYIMVWTWWVSAVPFTQWANSATFSRRYSEEFITRIALLKHFVQLKHVIWYTGFPATLPEFRFQVYYLWLWAALCLSFLICEWG